jgi:hypothetical protein
VTAGESIRVPPGVHVQDIAWGDAEGQLAG